LISTGNRVVASKVKKRPKKVPATLVLSSIRAVMAEQRSLTALQHTLVKDVVKVQVFPIDKNAVIIRCKGDSEDSIWNCGSARVASQFASTILDSLKASDAQEQDSI
jgi:hypothetical protein